MFHPFYIGPSRNFFNSIPFWTIFSAPNAPIRVVQILIGHQKQWNLLFGFGSL
jgi:hypothetical protein